MKHSTYGLKEAAYLAWDHLKQQLTSMGVKLSSELWDFGNMTSEKQNSTYVLTILK